MAQKSIVWEFTTKDLVTYTGFLLTMAGGYYGIVNKIDTNQLKTDAAIQLISYRVDRLEQQNKSKVVYNEPREAILPESPRSPRNLLFIDTE
jgi:hypothetical protein